MSFFNKKVGENKKVFLNLLIILLISSLGIFVFGVEEAEAFLDFKKALLSGIATLLSWLLWGIGQLMNLAQKVITGLLSWTQFHEAAIVTIGWAKVRDITNLFFALVLLIIAFATILRLETYGMKQLLWKLIVAALLINFSLILASLPIDFSQVLTGYFVQALEKTEEGNIGERIAANLKIQKVFTPIVTTQEGQERFYDCLTKESACWDKAEEIGKEGAECDCHDCSLEGKWPYCEEQGCSPDQWLLDCSGLTDEAKEAIGELEEKGWGDTPSQLARTIVALILSNIILLVAFVCFVLFALFLLIRIIILWFLLIIAPIVWLLWILPATAHLFTQWWNSLLKWSFFAPIYMFFIWLTLTTWQTFLGEEGFSGATGKAMGSGPAVDQFLPALYSPQTFMGFVVLVGMLIGGLIAAQKMGVAGAGAAIGTAKFLGYGAGRGLSRWAAKGAPIFPEVLRKPIRQRLETIPGITGKALRGIAGIRRMAPLLASPQVWSRTLAARRARADAEAFGLAAGRLDDALEALRHPIAFARGRRTYFRDRTIGAEVSKRQEEIARAIQDEEQLVQGYLAAKDPIEKEAYLRQLAKINGINTLFAAKGEKWNPENYLKFLKKEFGPDRGAIVAGDLQAIGAYGAGNWMLAGAAKWDRDKQKMVLTTPEEQAMMAAQRVREVDVGKLIPRMHPNTFLKQDEKGNYTQLHDIGKNILKDFTALHIGRLTSAQPRTIKVLHEFEVKTGGLTKFAQTLPPIEQEKVKAVIEAIKEQATVKGVAEAAKAAEEEALGKR